MDSSDTKQIIIGYNAITDSCEAMLKPIKINLSDSETVAKMPKDTYDTLHWMKIDCASIQSILSRMDDYIGDLEESVYDDGEIDSSRKMISDILFDDVPTKTPNQPAMDAMADEIFRPKRVETNLVVDPTIAKFSKAAGL